MAIKLGGSGGISIPIGSSVDLLDTANTVARGGETFLKNGQLSNAATYPNAPVRNFMRSGTLATQSYGGNISPWGGLTTININLQGVATDETDSNLYRWVCTSDGYIHRLTARGAVWEKRRNLRDGVVFSTSATASYIKVMFNNAQNSDLTHSSSGNSKNSMLVVLCSNDGGYAKVAYLSPDLDTHYGTFTLSFGGSYAANVNLNYMACCIRSANSFIIGSGFQSYLYTWQFDHPAGTSGTISSNDDGRVNYSSSNTGGQYFNQYWYFAPEFVPWYSYGSYAGNKLGFKTVVNGSHRLYYWYTSEMLGVSGGWENSSNISSFFNGNVTGSYVAPAKHSTAGVVYHRTGQAAPFSLRSSDAATQETFPTAYSSTAYSGYTQESASKVWVGVSAENKIFRLHPTTYGSQTTIDTSSQQAPKQLAWYNDLVFNFAADSKIYRYNSTNNAYVGVTDATSYISAGNGAGIAIDSATGDLYLLDKSNSRIHKYNSSLVYQSYVTLSDTPHSDKTLSGLAINTTNDVFYVAENTNNQLRMYAFNGTYQNAFVAHSAAVDADYHDSHIVTLSSAAQTTVKVSDHDAVGSPTDGSSATFSSYTRVN